MAVEPRTFEGLMEWEFSDKRGPLDPHSPFTQLAQQSGPARGFRSSHPNWAASAASLLKPALPQTPGRQPLPPQSSIFSPDIKAANVAIPFRNPAFTTPRRPVDEVQFSEASGAESSPGCPDEASDCPNDTPDCERTANLDVMATITPSRVDKLFRYGKLLNSRRNQLSGKGELARIHRQQPATDPIRKRRRHLYDRDVSSVRHYAQYDDDDHHEHDDGFCDETSNGSNKGSITSFFSTLDRYPNAPERLYNWSRLLFNLVLLAGFGYFAWTVADALRNDINTANSEERAGIMAQIAGCERNYRQNECERKDRPALVELCNEWYECMIRNPDAIMRFKTFIKHIAEVMNVFAGTMHLKAWGFFFGTLLVCILANNLTLGRYAMPATAPTTKLSPRRTGLSPSAGIYGRPEAPAAPGSFVWVPVSQYPPPVALTPRSVHSLMVGEGTDTEDGEPPRLRAVSASTPSRRRSPVRNPSPSKAGANRKFR